MIDTILLIVLIFTALMFVFFWYAKYSTKSGFALDENKNDIPDSWERYSVVFKLKSYIVLLLGILIGYLLSNSSYL